MATTIKELLAAIAKQPGATVPAEALAAVERQHEGMVIADPAALIQEGHVTVPKSVYDSKTEDLKKYKEESRRLGQERDDLKAAVDAGQGATRQVIDALKGDNARLKKIADAFTAEKKEAWDAMKESIPETLKQYYSFPKEGEELTVEQLLSNAAKLDEHTAAGVSFETAGGNGADKGAGTATGGSPPKSPPAGGKGTGGRLAWGNKSPVDKITVGYSDPNAPKTHEARFDGK